MNKSHAVVDAPCFTVADALRQHVPGYLKTFGNRVPLGHRKVLSYITRCRTGELGNVMYACKSCKQKHWVGRSCGNRHCPNCQKHKTAQWLARQTDKLLPVQHFVVTFTVPMELRPLLRANQKAGYDALFRAGSQTIRTLLKNPKNLGSQKLGFFGALHTWGRDLKDYHPHVHFVVPGGGVSDDGSRWLQTPENFLFAHAPAIALYKKLFARAMRKAGLYHHMPHGVLKKNWVVDIKPVGNGQAVLKYLAPYVYRVAISDNRIESVDDAGVTYRVTPSGGKRSVQRHATGEQFVRSFAQHILPSGFQKIRYYGFMSPNCKLQLANIRWLVWLFHASKYWLDVLAGQRLRTAGNDRTDHTDLQQLRRRVGTGRSGAGQRKSNPQQHAPRASTAINNRANCLMSNALHSLQSEQSEIHETLRCSVPLKVRTHRSLATDAGQSHRKTGAKKRRVAPSPAATWSGNRSTGRGWSRNHQLPDRHIGIKTQQRPA